MGLSSLAASSRELEVRYHKMEASLSLAVCFAVVFTRVLDRKNGATLGI